LSIIEVKTGWHERKLMSMEKLKKKVWNG